MGHFFAELTDGISKININMPLLAPEFTTALGYLFEKGCAGYEQNYDLALSCYEEAANRGNVTAVNNVGWMYLNGYAVPKNEPRAVGFFCHAARMGSDLAMVNLGNIHEAKKEYPAALYWYQKAAEMGNPKGIFNCANMLHWGWGVPQNYGEAHRIFHALFEAGYLDGTCFYLGFYAEQGLVSSADFGLAIRYYTMGAELGDKFCCTNLGRMYSLGIGCTADKALAFALYKRAGELGDALGYTNLAWMYETGDSIPIDISKAAELYQIAAGMGEENAVHALERLIAEGDL